MARTLLIFRWAGAALMAPVFMAIPAFLEVPAVLQAKDRAWLTGQLLDKNLNPYLRPTSSNGVAKLDPIAQTDGGTAFGVNVHQSQGDVVYDSLVIDAGDRVYLVEYSRFKSYKAPRLSLVQPLTFAVEKERLWIKDLDHTEYETRIVKQREKEGNALAAASPAPAAPVDVKKPEAKPERAKPEQARPEQARPEQAKIDKPKTAKPDNLFATAAVSKDDLNPPKAKPAPPPAPVKAPADTKPAADPKPAPSAVASVTAPKPVQKIEAAPVQAPAKAQPVTKAEPAAKPETAKTETPVSDRQAATRASAKDRAWQSGKLLSVPNNNYFLNVTYTSDTEGTEWPFKQGSDGRYTVSDKVPLVTTSPYTYDNYVFESEFVAYLVQRMRPKTSPPARFPGAQPLKFAVEKTKMWVIDEDGKEYEMKIIKLIQKDAIVDPLTRAAAK